MDETWATVYKALERSLPANKFKIWIDPLVPLRLDGQILYLGCPNHFFMGWVREHYSRHLEQALSEARGRGLAVESVKLELAPPPKAEAPDPDLVHKQFDLPRLNIHSAPPLRFNPRFTFSSFIVGKANQYAFAATQAMALGRELNSNSLFLYSDHGLGKSHLSQALGQQILLDDQRRRVYYLTAEDFTNEMVHAIKNRSVEEFKNKYRRECDVLVIEEIHFLSGKEKVQAELAYALDCLEENGKRVVFTSSKLPKDIPRLGRQFSSRISNSIISTIEPPDYATRLRILEYKAKEMGLKIGAVPMEFMAQRIKRDVRQMESCLNSLSAKSRLLSRSIDMSLIEETLADLIVDGSSCTPEAIRRLVCRQYNVTVDELLSKSRKKHLVLPRNLGMYLCRKMTTLSLEAIGELFGRNHSTVIYAVNLVENRSRRDTKLKAQLDFLVGQIQKTDGQSPMGMA